MSLFRRAAVLLAALLLLQPTLLGLGAVCGDVPATGIEVAGAHHGDSCDHDEPVPADEHSHQTDCGAMASCVSLTLGAAVRSGAPAFTAGAGSLRAHSDVAPSSRIAAPESPPPRLQLLTRAS